MILKYCPKCKESKELENFSKNKSRKDGLQRICKLCIKKQDKVLYQKNKNKVKSRVKRYNEKIKDWYFNFRQTLKCSICGEPRYWVLEWHHLDPSKKDFNIGDKVYGAYSINTIKEEINKCICVCSNCHKDIHFKLKE